MDTNDERCPKDAEPLHKELNYAYFQNTGGGCKCSSRHRAVLLVPLRWVNYIEPTSPLTLTSPDFWTPAQLCSSGPLCLRATEESRTLRGRLYQPPSNLLPATPHGLLLDAPTRPSGLFAHPPGKPVPVGRWCSVGCCCLTFVPSKPCPILHFP